MIINSGEDYNSGWTVCIDEYLDPNNNGHYTTANCSSKEGVADYPSEVWGYPRVWNASGTQWIHGEEVYP